MFKINSKTHRNLSSVKNDEEEKGATGTFMDSSLSRQSPGGFRFQFGKRSVLKGLEWGLAAVLQHQKSYKAASTSCSLSNIQILITDPMNYLSYYSNSCGTGTGNGTGTVLGGGGEDQLENVWDNDDCMIRFDVDIKNVERVRILLSFHFLTSTPINIIIINNRNTLTYPPVSLMPSN